MLKRIFAVVHVKDAAQVQRNLRVAEQTGCDGAFLISHGEVSPQELWGLYFQMMRMTHLTLGINQLSLPTSTCISEAYALGRREGLKVPMIWADNYKHTHDDRSLPDATKDFKQSLHSNELLLFGGVAFKYQPEASLAGNALATEAQAAIPYVDVLTTSGAATGSAPPTEKIRTIREAIGPSVQLAVASGITTENVDGFLPYVDFFLVSTGISKDFYTIDATKTHRLARRIKSF